MITYKHVYSSCFIDHWESLQQTVSRSSEGTLGDVWDGAVLKNYCTLESNTIHLAFALSTDGVQLYKSTSVSLWPVYLMLLNLPVEVRSNQNNIVLAGVWVGHAKPLMELLLEPVLSALEQFSSEGFQIKVPSGMVTITGKLVMCVIDLPAKAPVLCAKQFNGEYGCFVCLHPGKCLSSNARIYLPELHSERTHDRVQAAATHVVESNSCVQGIMGPSPLSATLDLVDFIPVDYMHCRLEGVVKMLLNSWTDSTNHRKPFYVGCLLAQLDNELLKQQPPREFTRCPRSIKKHLKYWKASELKYWLLIILAG